MVYVQRTKHQYDPFNLPRAIDFRLATRDLPLSDAAKTKIQIQISKMDRRKVKETMEYLSDMRYTALNHKDYKMAAYCKSVGEFVKAYYESVKAQEKI